MAKTKFPKELFVTEEIDIDGDVTYFTAYRHVDNTIGMGENRVVGIYKLDRTVNVTSRVEIIGETR
jgi:hypothetical protein